MLIYAYINICAYICTYNIFIIGATQRYNG